MADKVHFTELSNVKCKGPLKTRNAKTGSGCPHKKFLKTNLVAKMGKADRCYKCYNVDHPQQNRPM